MIPLVAQAEDVAVVAPLLLHDLELPGDAGVPAHEDEATVLPVVLLSLCEGQEGTVGRPAPDDPMPSGHPEAPGRTECVARIGAADVSPERAHLAVPVSGRVVEVVVGWLVARHGAQVGDVGAFRGQFDGRPVTPSAHDLGGKHFIEVVRVLGRPGLGGPVGLRLTVEVGPKSDYVLVQLPPDHEGAVA